MNEFVLLFDLISAAGIITVAYLLYKKFYRPGSTKERARETAYEEGFSDAVKYFGLKKLYEDDPVLKRRMESVFGEAGVTHRIAALLEQSEDRAASQSSKERTKPGAGKIR
jgi:hypothetical protein